MSEEPVPGSFGDLLKKLMETFANVVTPPPEEQQRRYDAVSQFLKDLGW